MKEMYSGGRGCSLFGKREEEAYSNNVAKKFIRSQMDEGDKQRGPLLLF